MRLRSLTAVGFALTLATAAPAMADAALGTDGDDVYIGTAQPDEYDGLAGNDTISGGGGADILLGGVGNDTVDGGAGPDYLHGGLGDNKLDPGIGTDEVYAGSGNDTVTLVNDGAFDLIQCGEGYDVVLLVGGLDVNDEIGVTCEDVRRPA